MGVHHIFDRIRDDLARGKAVEHPVVAHGNSVVDGDRIEFLGDSAGCLDLGRNQLAEVLQMHMARHELGEGIRDRDDRLAEISVFHAGRAPEAASACHVTAVRRRARAIGGHERGSRASRIRAEISLIANFAGGVTKRRPGSSDLGRLAATEFRSRAKIKHFAHAKPIQ
jgi:hypothetical protein